MGTEGASIAVPLRGGAMLPPLPPGGIRSRDDLMAIPGAQLIPYETAVPGPAFSTYAYTKINPTQSLPDHVAVRSDGDESVPRRVVTYQRRL